MANKDTKSKTTSTKTKDVEEVVTKNKIEEAAKEAPVEIPVEEVKAEGPVVAEEVKEEAPKAVEEVKPVVVPEPKKEAPVANERRILRHWNGMSY